MGSLNLNKKSYVIIFFVMIFIGFSSSVEAACGDFVIEQGEQCDDGNLINGDGCTSVCVIEQECYDVGNSFSFTTMSDSYVGTGENSVMNMLRDAIDEVKYPSRVIPRFSLIAGDWTYYSNASNLMSVVSDSNYPFSCSASNQDWPYFIAVGNHETKIQDGLEWASSTFGPTLNSTLVGITNFKEGPYRTWGADPGESDRWTTYSFDYKNTHFVIVNQYYNVDNTNNLNTIACYVQEIYDWVDNDLASTNKKIKFVVGHEPAWPPCGAGSFEECINSSNQAFEDFLDPGNRPRPHSPLGTGSWGRDYGFFWSNSLDDAGCTTSNTTATVTREQTWQMFSDRGVTAHFIGHTHNYASRLIEGDGTRNRDNQGNVLPQSEINELTYGKTGQMYNLSQGVWEVDSGIVHNSNGAVYLLVTIQDDIVNFESYDMIGTNASDIARIEWWSVNISSNTEENNTEENESQNSTGYGTLGITMESPTNEINVDQNQTFKLNATVSCMGNPGDICGTINAFVRYNLSANPDTNINILQGANPFYVASNIGNLSLATYDNVNIRTQESASSGFLFKPDGTKFYEAGRSSGGDFYQSSCTTAWDLSTCSYDNVNIQTQDGTPSGMFFKSDGTKLYEIGNSRDLIYQYSCPSAWDLSSCSYNGVNIQTQDSAPTGLFFKSDGTKLYEAGKSGNLIYQYSCPSAWDLSSCTYDNVNIQTQDSFTTDLFFKSDGTKLYEAGNTRNLIYQSSCTTAWDLSTCSYDNVNIQTQDSTPVDLFLSNDGTKLYEQGRDSSGSIYQYSLEQGGTGENPQTSSQTLEAGESETFSWTINVETATPVSYLVDVFFNSSFGNSLVPDNSTTDKQVDLNPTGGDTTAPEITIVSPTNTTFSTGAIDYNITLDEALHTAYFSVDSSPNLTLNNDSNTNYFNLGSNHQELSDGLHNITFWVNDTNGNANINTVFFTVDLPENAAPQWSNSQSNGTFISTLVLHTVNWVDETALSGYIFSFDNGAGVFVNDSFVSMSGTNDLSNVIKILNSEKGTTIKWKVYANDSMNQFNVTDEFTYITTGYGTLGITVGSPTDSINVNQNEIFNINSTVSCMGNLGDVCGAINAFARYNLSANPDTNINVLQGANPFYIAGGDWENLSSATYDNVNIQTQDSKPSGLFFKSDGTRLYEVGKSRDLIYQSSCTTAWDLSTCTYDNVNIQTQDSSPTGLFFKSDGTKLYEAGNTRNLIYQYSCSSAWDLSTCTYDNVNIQTQDSTPTGLFFKSDGTRLYEAGKSGNLIYQYSCSSAWDLSSCYYDNVNIQTQDSSITDLFFKSDGTKLYEAGNTRNLIYQYSCSSAWDLSSCYYNNVNILTQDRIPAGLFFKSDGTRLYELGSSSDSIYQYSLEQGGTGENPQTSSQTLEAGESETFSWTINVETATPSSYLVDVFFNSDFGNSLVPDNSANDRQVNLNF